MDGLERLNEAIIVCRRCPRLVRWREACANQPPRRYVGEGYWAKPLAGFGDARARLLVVGLAPAAHGGNRTGRMFTGDRSGDWLYAALHKAGFARHPYSYNRKDGQKLKNCYITAAVHCSPPANKPSASEFKRCGSYLVQELTMMGPQLEVVIVLGKIAFDSFLKAYQAHGGTLPKPRPKFGHAVAIRLPDGPYLICSYHPSQQNTFTGKLTEPMFDAVFEQARAALS